MDKSPPPSSSPSLLSPLLSLAATVSSSSSSDHGDLDWPSPNETMRPDQLTTVIILERVGASASLIGVLAIFVTYALFKRLRTVPNLFITMASVANVGASVACLIGRDGVAQGEDSALCQAQAFMLEMLMQSDPWWSLAMAVNVFLVFFHGASTATFRQNLWIYAVICYGVPFVPALVLLFVRDSSRGYVYGDATLWCWIEPRWNALRIYTYYLPIWVCIFFSVIIYGAVGTHVFRQRNILRNITFSNIADDQQARIEVDHRCHHNHPNQPHDHQDSPWSSQRDSAEKNIPRQVHYGTAVTEVQIVSHNQTYTPPISPRSPASGPQHDNIYSGSPPGHFRPYSIQPPHPAVLRPSRSSAPVDPLLDLELLSTTPVVGDDEDQILAQVPSSPSPSPSPRSPRPKSPPLADTLRLPSPVHDTPLAPITTTSTAKTSTSTAITSFSSPSSSSSTHPRPQAFPRLHPHHHNNHPSFLTTISSTKPPRPRSFLSHIPLWPRVSSFFDTFRLKYRRVDSVKKAYLRTSAIFALSVLFTWTPSSINRVYSLLHPETVSYGLNVASAIVLPLQGVWNAVIYFSTSWRPLCDELDARRTGRTKAELPEWKKTGSGGCGGGHVGGGASLRIGSGASTDLDVSDDDYEDDPNNNNNSSSSSSNSTPNAGSKFNDRGSPRSRSEEEIDFDRVTMPPSRRTAMGEVRAIRGSF